MIIDDYEHQITRKIDAYQDKADFPQLDEYHITKAQLDDYLFDKQAILDSEGSPRSQYTISGIMIVIPVVICSLFNDAQLPWGRWTFFVAVAIGLVLALLVKTLKKLSIFIQLRKLRQPDIECYLSDVLSYPKHFKVLKNGFTKTT
jgi:hypothetical protein